MESEAQVSPSRPAYSTKHTIVLHSHSQLCYCCHDFIMYLWYAELPHTALHQWVAISATTHPQEQLPGNMYNLSDERCSRRRPCGSYKSTYHCPQTAARRGWTPAGYVLYLRPLSLHYNLILQPIDQVCTVNSSRHKLKTALLHARHVHVILDYGWLSCALLHVLVCELHYVYDGTYVTVHYPRAQCFAVQILGPLITLIN